MSHVYWYVDVFSVYSWRIFCLYSLLLSKGLLTTINFFLWCPLSDKVFDFFFAGNE